VVSSESLNGGFLLDCGVRVLDLSRRTHLMGILNVTPDSFYDGGRYFDLKKGVERGVFMAEKGADIIDVGGESTRPGADSITPSEEIERVIPVIEELRKRVDVPISIDTRKSEVAEAAIEAGANIVNDISGLRHDPNMASLVARCGVPVVVMHIKGSPKNMQDNPVYQDLIGDIVQYLKQSIKLAINSGIAKDKIIIDPGIGFGKQRPDNFLILKELDVFKSLGYPLLVGVSRKSFIGWALNLPEEERLMGTAAAVAACALKGVHIVRVHDIEEMKHVVHIADLIRTAEKEKDINK